MQEHATTNFTRPRFALRVLIMALILLFEIGWVGEAFYNLLPAFWQSKYGTPPPAMWSRCLLFVEITLVFCTSTMLLLFLDYIYQTGMRWFWIVSMFVCITVLGVVFWGTALLVYLHRTYADIACEYITSILVMIRHQRLQMKPWWIDGLVPAPQ